MCTRGKHGGKLLWMLNLVVRGVGSALLIPLGLMECGYGRIPCRPHLGGLCVNEDVAQEAMIFLSKF
jgi:hypothetical protein